MGSQVLLPGVTKVATGQSVSAKTKKSPFYPAILKMGKLIQKKFKAGAGTTVKEEKYLGTGTKVSGIK